MEFCFYIFCLLALVSCTDNKAEINTCNLNNPLEELAFLKDAKDNIDQIDCGGVSSIIQYTFNSAFVFEVNICSQIGDAQTLVYDCAGEIVCTFGGIAGVNTCPDFNENATNKMILWEN